ncbi:Outer membrane vitamin B12 receptor BtuB [Collimonas arenae]|uniref:Outer membrane vitamin B12 receptor BtuB n=1 Tax=Collimonas arenae TaxID=279058 RepID=A0A0A1FLW1_9BURK|nr:Outer membrane vitamin B12 receptor BtuB [Collimonas arenae]
MALAVFAACNLIGMMTGTSHAATPQTQPETTLDVVHVSATREAPNAQLPLDETGSTGSRLGLTLRETPASVSIVDRAAIEARGASDTQQILKGVPGITASSPPGSAGFVSYRGFSGSQITQLFNGITVQYDTIAARPVDSWIYDRVEAVGGASSFLYGAGAVGGSINYITKLANRDGNATQLFGSYGSHNTSVLAFGLNRKISDDRQGIANYFRIDASRSAGDGYVDGVSRRANNIALSLLSDFTPNLSHTLAYEYQKETVKRPYWGTPLLNPILGDGRIDSGIRFKNYNASDALYQQNVQWLRSILDYRLSSQTSVKNTFYRYTALRDFRNVEEYRYNADNSQIIRSGALLQRHDQELIGDRLEVQHRGKLGKLASDWAGGIDYSVNKTTRFPRSLPGPVSTVDPYDFSTGSFFAIPGMQPGFSPDRTNHVSTFSAFLENRTRLLPNLSLVSGLRHDEITLEVDNKRVASASNPAYFKRNYAPTTGRAGLVLDITPHANVYIQYSTAADPPAGILSTASLGQVRDFNLSTGRQVEIGSKADFWNGCGNATLAAYSIKRKNLAVADPNNPTMTLPVGAQSSKGVELAFGLRPLDDLRIQGNLALVSAQFDDFTENVGGVSVSRAGKRPTNTPSRVANLWLDYRFLRDWNIGADARYVSSVYGNTANTVSAPAYTIYGASLSYRLQKSSSVALRVKNLTDKIYADNITSTPMFYLGAPRSVELALSVDL